MSRKSDFQVGPKNKKRVARPSKGSSRESITTSPPTVQPDTDDEWYATYVSPDLVPLSRDLVLGSRGQSLRHWKLDKVVGYLVARAATARTPATRGRFDIVVWKGTRICACLFAKPTGGFEISKYE
jgi:hypothetical protein